MDIAIHLLNSWGQEFLAFFQASEVRCVGSEEHEAQASHVSRASRPLAQRMVTSKAEARAVRLLCNKNGSNGHSDCEVEFLY